MKGAAVVTEQKTIQIIFQIRAKLLVTMIVIISISSNTQSWDQEGILCRNI